MGPSDFSDDDVEEQATCCNGSDAQRKQHGSEKEPLRGLSRERSIMPNLSVKEQLTLRDILRWITPAMTAGVAIFTSMWLLHIGTYYYVVEMVRLENSNQTAALVRDGALLDPVEEAVGKGDVNIHVLDALSASLPVFWFVGTVATGDLHLWTKVLVCNSLLALGKGILATVTIVPDSAGWQKCKKRLGPNNLAYLSQNVPNPREDGFGATAFTLLLMEISGPHHNRFGSKVRYCADMLYSGHTFFTTLYALALVELARRQTKRHKFSGRAKWLIVGGISLLCIVEQIAEVVAVLWDHFHYTMDILVAIMFTFLWYTNGPLILCAKKWAEKNFGFKGSTERESVEEEMQDHTLRPSSQPRDGPVLHGEGDIWVPPCCVPFCCFWDYHHLVSEEEYDRFQGESLEEEEDSEESFLE